MQMFCISHKQIQFWLRSMVNVEELSHLMIHFGWKSSKKQCRRPTPLLAKVYPFLKLSTDENSIIPQDRLHQGLAIFIISRFFLFISPFCELHPTTSWHLFGKYKEQFIVFTFATTFPFFFIFFFQTIMPACLCFHRIK